MSNKKPKLVIPKDRLESVKESFRDDSNKFLHDNFKTFSLDDLDGKSGVMRVTSDFAGGVTIRSTSFFCDDGSVYVISVDEV